jgi:monofunctional biosynthetic peptidoglycan transglycosylase
MRRGVLQWVAGLAAAFVLGSTLAVLAVRWINPPVTPLMVTELFRGVLQGAGWVSTRADAARVISPTLLPSVIAAEDARFFDHWGVDLEALRKARAWNLRHDREGRVRGASTITMQCARNVYLWQARTYVRKALEVWFAALMETLWSKRRILEVYLNVIEWGPGVYGADAAATRYFGVGADRLNARQAALLAAALPDPLDRNPGAPSLALGARASRIARRVAAVRLEAIAVR